MRAFQFAALSAMFGCHQVAPQMPSASAAVDSFAWLDSIDSPRTRQWILREDSAARSLIGGLPTRPQIIAQLQRYALPEVSGIPQVRGGRHLFVRAMAGQPPALVERVADGSLRTIHPLSFGAPAPLWLLSPDGSTVVYSAAGPSGASWKFVDVASGRESMEMLSLPGANAAAMAWDPRSRVLYYISADSSGQRVRRHELGTPTDRDVTLWRMNGTAAPVIRVTPSDDGTRLYITRGPVNGSWTSIISVRASTSEAGIARDTATVIISENRGINTVIGADATGLLVLTTADAPRGRLVRIPIDGFRPGKWRDIVPHGETTIFGAARATNAIVIARGREALLEMAIYAADGTAERTVQFPAPSTPWVPLTASVGIASSHPSQSTAYLLVLAANAQPRVMELDVTGGSIKAYAAQKLGYDPAAFVVERVVARARDGTALPAIIAYKKGLPLDGTAPLLLDVTGAQRLVAVSFWAQNTFPLIERGAVYAFLGVRGGAENGEKWHGDGSGRGKRRSVDDYLDAIDWFIAQRYTRSGRILAIGAGPTATIVTAAVNERPTAFAAIGISSPITDLVKLHDLPGGEQWTDDFGGRRDGRAAQVRRALSPLHHVRPACHPPTLVFAGERDDVQHPGHAYKYVASLRRNQTCDNPIVLRVLMGQGNVSFTAPLAEELAFFTHVAGLSDFRSR
jgi:prolyl oligopeptidase